MPGLPEEEAWAQLNSQVRHAGGRLSLVPALVPEAGLVVLLVVVMLVKGVCMLVCILLVLLVALLLPLPVLLVVLLVLLVVLLLLVRVLLVALVVVVLLQVGRAGKEHDPVQQQRRHGQPHQRLRAVVVAATGVRCGGRGGGQCRCEAGVPAGGRTHQMPLGPPPLRPHHPPAPPPAAAG